MSADHRPYRKRKPGSGVGGDIRESERLRPLFLAYVGRRRNAAVLADLGIDAIHGAGWLRGRVCLADRYQATVRAALDRAGVAPSPCS